MTDPAGTQALTLAGIDPSALEDAERRGWTR